MRPPIPLLLSLVALTLSAGCAGPRHAPQYGWLRKQGTRFVQQPVRPMASSGTHNSPAPDAAPAKAHEAPAVNISSAVEANATVALAEAHVNTPVRSIAATALEKTHSTLLPGNQDTAYYAPEAHRWNAKAITSLPLAVGTVALGLATQSIYILLIGGAIAFALGLIASRQCRDRQDRGKGFAVAAMALGAAALFFSLMVLILAA